MFLHQPAYLDQNLFSVGYPGQMHQVKIFQRREEKDVNTYIQLVNGWCGSVELRQCDKVAQVAFHVDVKFRAEETSALESAVCVGRMEMHMFLSIPSVSPDSLRCHFGKEGIRPSGFDEASPGVILSQHSPVYAPDTQHPTVGFLALRCDVSGSDNAFPLLRPLKTCHWPFRPYSRRDACRTVPAVPDLLALPW